MVADAALWAILVVVVAFLACGCHYTRPAPKIAQDAPRRDLDRAA